MSSDDLRAYETNETALFAESPSAPSGDGGVAVCEHDGVRQSLPAGISDLDEGNPDASVVVERRRGRPRRPRVSDDAFVTPPMVPSHGASADDATVYERVKRVFLSGDQAAAARLARTHASVLSQDSAGCTLMAAIAMAAERSPACLAWLEKACDLEPSSASVWRNLGAAHQQFGEPSAAVAALRRATELDPSVIDSWRSLGNALITDGGLAEAVACFDRVLRVDPQEASAHAAKGRALQGLGRAAEAAAAYERALAIRPTDADALANLGVLRQQAGDAVGALSLYDKALGVSRDHLNAWSNRAKALKELHHLSEAITAFDSALALKPGDADLLTDRGICRLLAGDYRRGFRDYEARIESRPGFKYRSTWPIWRGQSLKGRSILVLAEQGFGDTFQFLRYLTPLKEAGARVTLQAPPSMLPVLAGVEGLVAVTAFVSPRAAFDYQISLLSIPDRLGLERPYHAGDAYLAVSPERAKRWADRIGQHGFRIGIAWQGNPAFAGDAERSIPLTEFAPLARAPGVRLISLQKRDGLDQLAAWPADATLERLPDEVDAEGAFVDTAAVMMGLDLVITSDTAIAHLAGALGRPVWLALSHMPDWRWLLEGAETPWYPSMRLFRQKRRGEWSSVFAAMAAELAAPAGAPAASPTIPCSIGELVDKITILEIKAERIADEQKLAHIRRELDELRRVQAAQAAPKGFETVFAALKGVNEQLWDIENELRLCESAKTFDDRFIALSRSVYATNDRRFQLKHELNALFGSVLMEQKSYIAS